MLYHIKKIIPRAIFSMAMITSSVVYAETVPGTDFNLHFESANIVGTGRSINVHRVPVVIDSTGQTLYFDVSFKLSMDNNQQLVFDNFSQITSASLNSADNFIPGTYKDQEGNTYVVSGGGIVNDRSSWSIRSSTDGHDLEATWMTGTPTGNALIVGEPALEFLTVGPSYGIVGSENIPTFSSGGVIGVLQAGSSISITGYNSSNGNSTGTLVITPNN